MASGTKESTALGWSWSDNKDEWQLARIAEADRLIHMYVVGATGSGKTKFLESLIRQDIDHRQGFGVIDPHGDLIDDLCAYLAVAGLKQGEAFLRERVVLIDLTNPHSTVAFNPIEQLPGVPAGEQAAELISSFRKIWSDSWGVRMEDLLRNSLIALSEAQLSLVSLPKFLTDGPFRKSVTAHLTHPIARDYFNRFERLSDRNRLTWAEPVLNKINALLANDRVRQLLAAPHSTVNLREVMDSGKILLVKLDKGRLKDAADLIGSLLLGKLQLAAFSRSDIPAWQRRPFYLYVDEFQNFASASFGVLLSEARKYGLSLVMAHQTLAQVPRELQSLILGNVGVQVVFRVNRSDAEKLAKESFQYSGYRVKSAMLHKINYWSLGEEWEQYTEALQGLEPRQAWIKHKIEGGLIQIETADVDQPWQALGLSPWEFAEVMESAPIGAAYLLPRSELDGSVALPMPVPSLGDGIVTDDGSVASPVDHGSNPTDRLNEDELAFLQLVLANPDLPVSKLYQEFGASVWKGAKLREALVESGYLIELETRRGKRGRLAKFLLPTTKALAPVALPPGRGGPLHRHLQQLVVAEAKEKGYTAVIEHELFNGGIVDVHVASETERVAVEVSITTAVEDELEHIQACLEAGYDRLITLLYSESVRQGLEERLDQVVSSEDRERIELVDVSRVGALLGVRG